MLVKYMARLGMERMYKIHFLTPIKVNILESINPTVVVEQCATVLSPYAPDVHHHDQETQSNIPHPNGIKLNGICKTGTQQERTIVDQGVKV